VSAHPANPQITIAVISWNTRDLLHACLSSMEADASDGLADVWVVDNGSTDESVELVRTEHPWVNLVVPGGNLGFGPAVNLVARETRTPWIAPANADIELTPKALAALLAAAEADHEAGVIAPKLMLADGTAQGSVQPFPLLGSALLMNLRLNLASERVAERLCLPWEPDRAAHVDWATGAFLLVRREVYEQVGGFDERQWMYAEDVDLCWRVHRAGWKVRYEPSASVRHALSAAAERAFGDEERRAANMALANYVWLARRKGVLYARLVALVNVSGAAARLALYSLLGRWLEGDWARRKHAERLSLRLNRLGLKARAAAADVP
jgi:N-acetylglucosaminyl-diphospho-decaprenol L-rhamnosyltransferase